MHVWFDQDPSFQLYPYYKCGHQFDFQSFDKLLHYYPRDFALSSVSKQVIEGLDVASAIEYQWQFC